jgi:hypothetical protein
VAGCQRMPLPLRACGVLLRVSHCMSISSQWQLISRSSTRWLLARRERAVQLLRQNEAAGALAAQRRSLLADALLEMSFECDDAAAYEILLEAVEAPCMGDLRGEVNVDEALGGENGTER